ncbi:chlorophyllase/cutinase-like alpha/beta fold protein [Amycolatopsis sp. PS_44_ISF1]|uniref:poly(ethylene terephthalate) hydrolase family protein n=1 Tax=Amycolatopsis sp. PS_44_ISF1 TaxID=2974917 RepID=UPI0028DDC380|nr:alpha/beta hydrolase [Amycolatopsis sp. PS_44_ISF1]MDT8909684.1 alpha/beta hydrolase [Amycolatopsis sp. PS_44_ISF1]
MASKPKQLLAELSHQGPHEVLRGNLALVGLPGIVFTPRSGLGLPAIAFGHGWVQPTGRYRQLLHHLASWGVVAAAPATQRGPLPSHRLLATDLLTTLDVITTVRLGPDGISVDPEKLGLAGHSTGGGAAVLAAGTSAAAHATDPDGPRTGRVEAAPAAGGGATRADVPSGSASTDAELFGRTYPRIGAVATITAAQTLPPATEAAKLITAPGLHLAAEEDLVAPAVGHAEAVANAWAGPVQLRTLGKASHLGVTEGRHWSQLLLHGKPHRGTQQLTRALFTAFFLTHLTGTDKYRPLLESDVKRAPIDLPEEPAA